MDKNIADRGYFIFSLDTELATGHFDCDETRHRIFSQDGSAERKAIYRLINLLKEFNIVGTWSLVGHLFYEACENCEICPMKDWDGMYSSFEEVYKTNNPLWYGSDIIDVLLDGGDGQEIAFHGYSHRIFDEDSMSSQEAKMEVQEWFRVGKRKGVTPSSVTFPRNRVGHLGILREAGMICYRGEPKISPLSTKGHLWKFLKTIDKILGISQIPIYDLTCIKNNGLVVLQPSEYLFDFNRKVELFLDTANLHNLRIRRIIHGVKRAAKEKKMIHIWAHPFEFRTQKDFSKLRQILISVADEVKAGRMQSVGMAEMARLLIDENRE
jgi:hypothetical protein